MSSDTLNFEQTLKASPSQVYYAFTNASALREWCCDISTVDPKPGGRLYMAWNSGFYSSGEFTALEEDKSISFSWHGRGEPGPTQINVTISKADEGTKVALAHGGIGAGEEWEQTRDEINEGWSRGLKNLASVLETGEDIRVVMQPMLGIVLNDFDEDIAKQLGVPVSEGVRLDDTLEGMGARATGLQKDDVIVSMNGVEVEGFVSLGNALSGLQAGDTIEVVFYRGGEKKSVDMELSKRPLPETPENQQVLAEAVQQQHDEISRQLDELLSGITDEEASFKPSPDEWSVKEALAHLIQSERGYHFYIAELVGGHERWSDDYAGNLQAFIDATISAYPTIHDMIEELIKCQKETVHLLANLPDKFLERKGSFWRLSYGALVFPSFHENDHIEQMQSTIEAARTQ